MCILVQGFRGENGIKHKDRMGMVLTIYLLRLYPVSSLILEANEEWSSRKITEDQV